MLEALTQLQVKNKAFEQWVSVREDNQRGIRFYEARGFNYMKSQREPTNIGELQVSLRYFRTLYIFSWS